MYKNSDWLVEWKACWDDFVEETKVCSYWRKEPAYDKGGDDFIESEEEDEICDDIKFFSRGTSSRLVIKEKTVPDMTGDTILGEEGTPLTADDDSESEDEGSPLPGLPSPTSEGKRLSFDSV